MWEFARVGQPVSIITVTDRDLEDKDRQVVNITDGNQAGHFALDSVGGVHVVRLARQLDRQTVSQYELTITAEDGGTPTRTATATIVINVASEHLNKLYVQNKKFIFVEAVVQSETPPTTLVLPLEPGKAVCTNQEICVQRQDCPEILEQYQILGTLQKGSTPARDVIEQLKKKEHLICYLRKQLQK